MTKTIEGLEDNKIEGLKIIKKNGEELEFRRAGELPALEKRILLGERFS